MTRWIFSKSLLAVAAGSVAWVIGAGAVADNTIDSEPDNWLLAKYDLNGDALITQTEIASKKRNIFKHMDSDNDGGVSFEEYETMDIVKRQVLLKSRFNKLDLNQDGQVTEEEYTDYMGLFNSIDVDGDGTLTSTEMGIEQAKTEAAHCLLWFCFRSELD